MPDILLPSQPPRGNALFVEAEEMFRSDALTLSPFQYKHPETEMFVTKNQQPVFY